MLSQEHYVRSEWAGPDLLITTQVRPTWLGRLFGVAPTERQYRGTYADWREHPSGLRCGTLHEAWLSKLWARWQREQEQEAIAHR